MYLRDLKQGNIIWEIWQGRQLPIIWGKNLFTLSDNPELLNLVKKALEQKKIVAAIPKSNLSELGMSSNYSLTVLGCNKKGGLTLRYCFPLIVDRPSIPLNKEGIF